MSFSLGGGRGGQIRTRSIRRFRFPERSNDGVRVLGGTAPRALPPDAPCKRIRKEGRDLLASWAGALFSGVVAVVALVFLVNRRFIDLAVFLGAVILVGGLVFAPDTVQAAVTGIWETVVGSE